MFSIVILTYNEENNLQSCLDSIKWCEDIVVIDSYSVDRTVEIAKNNGAKVYQNKFSNFGDQRNFGNKKVKSKWVFHLDADEHFNSDLKGECESAIKKYQFGAFMVPSKMMLFNKWIKYASSYPVFQMRFHRIGDANFMQKGHGQQETDLKKGIGFFKIPYKHFAFEKGISNWLLKHVIYAQEEAIESKNSNTKITLGNLFSKNSLKRRREIKRLSYKVPFKPLLRFLYFYIFKMGFRDGKVGYEYCKMQFIFEAMIDIKLFELHQNKKEIKS